MNTSPTVSFALSTLFPIALLIVLLGKGVRTLVVGQTAIALFFELLFILLLTLYVIRVWGLQNYQKSKTWLGIILMALGLVTYVAAGLLGHQEIQQMSVFLVYAGTTAFLGGATLLFLTLPSSFLLSLLVVLGDAGHLEIEILEASLIIASAVVLFLVFKQKVTSEADCEYCKVYSREHETFCLYCGKKLGKYSVPVRGKPVLVVLVILTIFLISPQLPVSLVASGHLVPHIDSYTLDGYSTHRLFFPPAGFTVSAPTVLVNNLTKIYYYKVSSVNNITVDVWLTFNDTQFTTRQSLLNTLDASSVSSHVYSSAVFPLYNWTWDNRSFEGTFVINQVKLLTNGNITKSFVMYMIGQDTTSFEALNGHEVETLATEISNQQQTLSASVVPIDIYEYVLLPYLYLFETVILVGTLVVFAALARRADRPAKLAFDSSLGLSRYEFSTLANISLGRKKGLGSEFLNLYQGAGGWTAVSAMLKRWKQMGLVCNSVQVRRGNPKLIWRVIGI